MAAFKFLHIGKASARIDELEAQVASLTKERDEALAAVKANGAEIIKQAEDLQTQLTAANGQVTKWTLDTAAMTGIVSAQAAEIKSLGDRLAAKDGEVKIKVAREVAQ